MNAAGDKMVVGAFNQNRVLVYAWDGSSWDLEQNIYNGYSYFGGSVDMNAAGDRIVVGAYNSNRAFTYSWNGSTWTQEANLSGSTYFGWDVSMSNGGDTIAISEPYYSSQRGYVRTYAWNGSSWSQFGGTSTLGESYSDYSGRSISLNGSGNRIVIGAIYNDANGSNSGHVRVYQLSGSTWVKMGSDIDGGASSDYFGWSVDINNTGSRIVVGAIYDDNGGSNTGSASVYDWDGSSWSLVGSQINGSGNSDYLGWSVSINNTGDKIIAGIPYEDEVTSNAGQARIYEFSNGSWVQSGSNINGKSSSDYFGNSTAMNASGNRFAVGAYYNDDGGSDAGQVRVFEYDYPCPLPTTLTIIQGVDASFSYPTYTYCSDDTDPVATLLGDTAGTFSASTGLNINSSTGQIDLDASTIGTHTVYYTVSNTNCTDVDSVQFTIDQAIPGFTYGDTTFCTNQDDPTPTLTVSGTGTFSSTPAGLSISSSTGEIDLSASTAGDYDITFTPTIDYIQMGVNIDGEGSSDYFGYAVDINAAGNRMVVGAPYDDAVSSNSGHVRIFEWNDSAWVQLGADIDGEGSSHYLGWSVAMNDAGDRIIAGAYYANNQRGYAKIYEWNGSSWNQVGAKLEGTSNSDHFGFSVAMSNSGNRVAVGARYDDDGGGNSGSVSMYDWNGGSWSQVGSQINGPSSNYYFGSSIALNGAGDRLVIGSYNSNRTYCYSFNGSSWAQMGSYLSGSNYFGWSVDMNDAGDVIAVSEPSYSGWRGRTRLLQWNGSSWVSYGNSSGYIYPYENSDYTGYGASYTGRAISLNAAGDRIAIGGFYNAGGGSNSGFIRVYELNSSNNWVKWV